MSVLDPAVESLIQDCERDIEQCKSHEEAVACVLHAYDLFLMILSQRRIAGPGYSAHCVRWLLRLADRKKDALRSDPDASSPLNSTEKRGI